MSINSSVSALHVCLTTGIHPADKEGKVILQGFDTVGWVRRRASRLLKNCFNTPYYQRGNQLTQVYLENGY